MNALSKGLSQLSKVVFIVLFPVFTLCISVATLQAYENNNSPAVSLIKQIAHTISSPVSAAPSKVVKKKMILPTPMPVVQDIEKELQAFVPPAFSMESVGETLDSTSVNLIRNSAFNTTAGSSPNQWNFILDSTNGNTAVTEEAIRTGVYGLKFSGGGSGVFGISQPQTKLVENRAYVFSAYFKAVNVPAGTTARLIFWDADKNTYATTKSYSFSGTKDWQEYTFTVNNRGKFKGKNWYPMIDVQGLKSGSFYVADSAITEGTAKIPYRFNAGGGAQEVSSILGDGTVLIDRNGLVYPAINGKGNLGDGDHRWDSLYLTNAVIDKNGNADFRKLTANGDVVLRGGAFEFSMQDNRDLVFKIKEGDNQYFAISTADAGEYLNLGNNTTNPNITINGKSITLSSNTNDIVVDSAASIDMRDSIYNTTGAVTIADVLSQTGSGQVTFSGNVDANSGVDVTGANLTVGGANFFVNVANGNITTAGDAAINGGDITSTGALNITAGGNTTINPTTGDVVINSSSGNLDVRDDIVNGAGAVTIADVLTQTGSGQVTFSGNVDANSGVDVTGAALTFAVGLSGDNFSVADTSGDTTTGGDLAVNGGDMTSTATTFNMLNTNVTTLNFGAIADVNVAGGYGSSGTTISSAGNVSTNGTLTVDGLATLNGGVTADSGVFTVADTTGAVHTGSTLDVDSNTTLGGNVTFDAGASRTITVATAADNSAITLAVVGPASSTAVTNGGNLVLGGGAPGAGGVRGAVVSNANDDFGASGNRWGTVYANTVNFLTSLVGSGTPSVDFSGVSAANLGLQGNSIIDADVSDTLTSSLFVGSGSSTSAVDLGTAEVAGVLTTDKGGTGNSSTFTQYGVIYAPTTTSQGSTLAGASANVVLHGNPSGAPTWSAVDLGTADVTGTLGDSNVADALTFSTLTGANANTITNPSSGTILINASTLNVAANATIAPTAAGTLAVQSNGVNNLSLDTGGAATVAIGNTNATTVSICNSTTCDTIDVGTNTDADTINLGDSNDTVNSPGIFSSTGTISSSGVVNFSGASSVRIPVGAGLSATGTCDGAGHAGKVYYANTTANAMVSGTAYVCVDDANHDGTNTDYAWQAVN